MGARLAIGHGLSVDADAIGLRFVRASGPGGQNVNNVSTAVELRFDLMGSGLPWGVKRRAAALAGRRLTGEGVLLLVAEEHRTQEMNRTAAIARLLGLLREAAPAPRPRVATRPSKGSRERRIAGKAARSGVKAGRARPSLD